MTFNKTSLIKAAMLSAACACGAAILPAHIQPARADDAPKPAKPDAYRDAYIAGREKLVAKDYAAALPLWEQARKLARTPKRVALAAQGYAYALLGLGNIALREKRYDEAKQMGEEVVGLTELDSRVLTGSAHTLLASVYREQGDMAGLMRESKAGMTPIPGMAEFLRDGKLSSEEMNQISYYSLIGDVRGKTLEQTRDALQAAAQNKDASREKRLFASLGVGNISMQLKQFAQAREQYTKTLAEFGQGMWLKAEVAQKIGDSYAAEGTWDLALESYDLALENTPERGPRDLAGLADASLRRKRDDAARRAG